MRQMRSDVEQVIEVRAFERRKYVAALFLTGNYTYNQIVKALREQGIPINTSTVSSDIAFLKKQWAAQASQSMREFMEREIAKLDLLEAHLASSMHELSPLEYVDRMLKIGERRHRLLGIDRSAQLSVRLDNASSVQGMTDDQLDEIIRRGEQLLTIDQPIKFLDDPSNGNGTNGNGARP